MFGDVAGGEPASERGERTANGEQLCYARREWGRTRTRINEQYDYRQNRVGGATDRSRDVYVECLETKCGGLVRPVRHQQPLTTKLTLAGESGRLGERAVRLGGWAGHGEGGRCPGQRAECVRRRARRAMRRRRRRRWLLGGRDVSVCRQAERHGASGANKSSGSNAGAFHAGK